MANALDSDCRSCCFSIWRSASTSTVGQFPTSHVLDRTSNAKPHGDSSEVQLIDWETADRHVAERLADGVGV